MPASSPLLPSVGQLWLGEAPDPNEHAIGSSGSLSTFTFPFPLHFPFPFLPHFTLTSPSLALFCVGRPWSTKRQIPMSTFTSARDPPHFPLSFPLSIRVFLPFHSASPIVLLYVGQAAPQPLSIRHPNPSCPSATQTRARGYEEAGCYNGGGIAIAYGPTQHGYPIERVLRSSGYFRLFP